MKLVIDIPQEVKEAFDKASKDNINFCFYDYNSVIGKAIKNGTPLEDIETLKHRSFIEGFYEAYQSCYRMFNNIKTEIDKLDFDFGDFYDHTEEIHEMIDKVWNKHTGKERVNETDN